MTRYAPVFRTLISLLLLTVAVAPWALPSEAAPARFTIEDLQSSGGNRVARVVEKGAQVHSGPADSYDVIANLLLNSQVEVVDQKQGEDGQGWCRVWLWNSMDGWMHSPSLSFDPFPSLDSLPPGGGGINPGTSQPDAAGATPPRPLHAQATLSRAVSLADGPKGNPIADMPEGSQATISEWATDEDGKVWFHVMANGADGWAPGSATTMNEPDPATYRINGKPIWNPVAGKGMWFTYDLLKRTPVWMIIQTAKANGVSHIYPEVGTTKAGFWGADGLDALIPAAHKAGIAVIPWVYTWLRDIPQDVDLTLQAARYVTPAGEKADGLGVDIEENRDPTEVKGFSQIVRASLGSDYLLVGITYPPQSGPGTTYPFREVGASFNVVAPMGYWHSRPVEYQPDYVYQYVQSNVDAIRQATGKPYMPIDFVAQTYDMFYPSETGPYNPSQAEIQAALQAAKDSGIAGIGFYAWGQTTAAEWRAIGDFAWSAGGVQKPIVVREVKLIISRPTYR